jgi:hypothetical protein
MSDYKKLCGIKENLEDTSGSSLVEVIQTEFNELNNRVKAHIDTLHTNYAMDFDDDRSYGDIEVTINQTRYKNLVQLDVVDGVLGEIVGTSYIPNASSISSLTFEAGNNGDSGSPLRIGVANYTVLFGGRTIQNELYLQLSSDIDIYYADGTGSGTIASADFDDPLDGTGASGLTYEIGAVHKWHITKVHDTIYFSVDYQSEFHIFHTISRYKTTTIAPHPQMYGGVHIELNNVSGSTISTAHIGNVKWLSDEKSWELPGRNYIYRSGGLAVATSAGRQTILSFGTDPNQTGPALHVLKRFKIQETTTPTPIDFTCEIYYQPDLPFPTSTFLDMGQMTFNNTELVTQNEADEVIKRIDSSNGFVEFDCEDENHWAQNSCIVGSNSTVCKVTRITIFVTARDGVTAMNFDDTDLGNGVEVEFKTVT